MCQLAQPQVGNGDEGGRCSEAAGRPLSLLQHAVHGLHKGVGSVVEHAANDAVEVLLERRGEPLEWIKPAAPRPADPALEVDLGLLGIVVSSRMGEHLAQAHLEPPAARALEIGPLQPVHGLDLRFRPTRRISAHAPQYRAPLACAEVTELFVHALALGLPLRAAHLVHRLVGQGHDVVAVIADLGVGQGLANALGVGRAHVDAGMGDSSAFAAMGLQVQRETLDRVVVASGRGEEQPPGLEVVRDGDVVLATLEAGVVDAHQTHAAHVLLGAGLGHIVLDTAPQLFVTHTQHLGGLAHRQALAQRQRQSLEHQREAAALASPRHRRLAGLAASRAPHSRHACMHPRLELEEIQMTPGAAHAIVNRLIGGAAMRANQALCCTGDLEVDSMFFGVEIDPLDSPRRLQPQGRGEQGFDLYSHDQALRKSRGRAGAGESMKRPVDLWTGQLAQASRLSARGALLWMAGWTTLRVAHASNYRPSAAHKLHRTPPPSRGNRPDFHMERRGTFFVRLPSSA